MTKLTLDYNEPKLYEALAISSQLPDYKLAFNLNNHLKSDFKRIDDFRFKVMKKEDSKFSLYAFDDNENQRKLFLLNNKIPGSFLFPELKQFDYILLIDVEYYDSASLQNLLKQLRKTKGILFAQNVDLENLKNYAWFAEEFELHTDREY